ncbi:MAG: DNA (cytosine-5-)-methyltransferase [Alphaproteobacteria bacterium]|nr:DNA (cytosine-5-)-methyltransferase [Alphaproteobacteria bacterium]
MRLQTTEFARLREKSRLSIEELAERLDYGVSTLYKWERGETKPRKAALEMLRRIVEETHRPANGFSEGAAFRFIDLFAGIGGFRLGFEAVGGECVFTSEWDEHSRKTYQANFPCSHEVAGDIRKVGVKDIPAFDVLLAGFPCQPFSIAGVSKKNALGRAHGFKDETQGTLFFDIVRILEHHRPAAFLLENVKNLVSHDKGNTFRVITKVLQEELGYKISYRVVDAKGYVPQHRERIFIVGFREDTGFDINKVAFADPLSGPKLESILHPEDGTEEIEDPFICGNIGRVNAKYTLSDKLWQYLKDYADKHKAKGNGFGFGLNGPGDVARTLSARYYKDGSEILIKQKGKNPRRLTPRECARLLGFDRRGREKFIIPVSDTQAYRQFGNAVVVPVVEEIARAMLPFIMKVRGDKRRKTGSAGEEQEPYRLYG